MDENNTNLTVLGLTSLALLAALSQALVALSAFKGRENLGWLDEIEANSIQSLKNSVSEGISMDTEAAGMNGAIAFVHHAFDQARDAIRAADQQ